MTTVQKVIRYLALAFAIFLIISIIGGVFAGLAGLSFFLSGRDRETVGEMRSFPIDGEFSSLSLELGAVKLKIRSADTFSVESNHNHLAVKVADGQLYIDETRKPFWFSAKGATVILNVPADFVFDNATIHTGAGKVEIDTLSVNVLDLDLGAGKADIGALTVNTRADIDGGAGALSISGGRLCNLDLDMGVGNLSLRSRIEGDSVLDFGVGRTDLTLLGTREDYRIELDKGVGAATLEGEAMQEDAVYGNGGNRLKIDGGVGSVHVDFVDIQNAA